MYAISLGEGSELRPLELWHAEEFLTHLERGREFILPACDGRLPERARLHGEVSHVEDEGARVPGPQGLRPRARARRAAPPRRVSG